MTEITSLGEIAKVISGQSPPGSTYNDQGEGLPFFQGKAEFGLVSPNIKKWCSQPVKIAEAGDILISVRAPVGPTNLADQQCCIGRGLAAIRPDTSKADRDYIHWALKCAEPKLIQKGQGSTFSAINRKDLQSIELPLPPLPEQRRIVDILNRANGIRRLRREAQEKARQVIPALFVKMFGDPGSNPKGWPIERLGSVMSNHDVRRIPLKVADRAKRQGPYPYYGASGVIDNIDDYLFDGRFLLVGEDGANLLARSKPIAFIAEGKFWVNNHAHILGENGKATLDYLGQFINLTDLREYITGSAQPKLTQKNLNQIPLPVPPLSLQQAFASRVSDIQAMIDQQDRMTAASERLVQSLMAEVFGG